MVVAGQVWAIAAYEVVQKTQVRKLDSNWNKSSGCLQRNITKALGIRIGNTARTSVSLGSPPNSL